jgi:hypothetical protein
MITYSFPDLLVINAGVLAILNLRIVNYRKSAASLLRTGGLLNEVFMLLSKNKHKKTTVIDCG